MRDRNAIDLRWSLGLAVVLALALAPAAEAQPAPDDESPIEAEADALTIGDEAAVATDDEGLPVPAAEGSDDALDDEPPPVEAAEPPALEPQPLPPPPTRSADDIRGEDVVTHLGGVLPGMQGRLGPDARQTARIRWAEDWPRYEFDELVLTLGFGAVIVLRESLPTRGDPLWTGGGLIDDGARDGLRLQQASARRDAAVSSSVITGVLVGWALLVDSLLVTGVVEGAWDVAWQLSLIQLEALVLSHATVLMVKLLARRDSPTATDCREDPSSDDPACANPQSAESFYSAHASGAFTSASLICLQHDVLDLYDSAWADAGICVTAMAAAATVGLLRVASDRNYLSDVLVGMVAGLTAGYLMPWLLHFAGGRHPEPRGAPELPPLAVVPFASDTSIGVMASGGF